MGLESIVNVSITSGTKAVTRAGFGVPLILGSNATFTGTKSYASITEVAADFATNTAEYLMANEIFSQSPKVKKLKIAKTTSPAVAQVETITPTAVNSTAYKVTINGTEYSYTSDADATVSEIVAGLIALINADTQRVTASGTTTLVLTADNAGEGFEVSVGSNLAIAHTTANVGIASDILNYADLDSDWYALLATATDDTTVREVARTIEAMQKIAVVRRTDSAIKTSSTTDIASELKAKGYQRTALFFNGTSAEKPDAALLGAILPFDPGSYTAAFKSLAGVTAAALTSAEENYMDAKNVNYYVEKAGVSIVKNGKMIGGEFIDVVQFRDWLAARMQERIFSRLVNVKKVPFTDPGIAIIEAEVRAQLQEGVRVGGLAADPAPEVSVPKAADVSSIDKANRLLPDVSFSATLAGAIHAVEIAGVISL